MSGLLLTRVDERGPAVDALADLCGGRAGLSGLLDAPDGLVRRGRRAWPRLTPGKRVHRAFTFDWRDRTDARWWPQGLTTSGDAGPDTPDLTPAQRERQLVMLAWYAKALPGDEKGGHGVRVTVYDLEARRYQHVLLVVPSLGPDGEPRWRPLRAHAGGLLWAGGHLHVAATGKGFWTARTEDLLRLPDPGSDAGRRVAAAGPTFGYRWVLPVTCGHRAGVEEGPGPAVEKLRYSFFSLDRSSSPPSMLVGEYARGKASRRLVRIDLDPTTLLPALDAANTTRPRVVGEGLAQMQGAVVADGRWYATTSHGRRTRGSLLAGEPGDLVRHRRATPMGPEDLAWWPERGELWSATEHPVARWIYAVRPGDVG